MKPVKRTMVEEHTNRPRILSSVTLTDKLFIESNTENTNVVEQEKHHQVQPVQLLSDKPKKRAITTNDGNHIKKKSKTAQVSSTDKDNQVFLKVLNHPIGTTAIKNPEDRTSTEVTASIMRKNAELHIERNKHKVSFGTVKTQQYQIANNHQLKRLKKKKVKKAKSAASDAAVQKDPPKYKSVEFIEGEDSD